jgi:hypothetical protein
MSNDPYANILHVDVQKLKHLVGRGNTSDLITLYIFGLHKGRTTPPFGTVVKYVDYWFAHRYTHWSFTRYKEAERFLLKHKIFKRSKQDTWNLRYLPKECIK